MPELVTFPLKTTLTAAIVNATRPVTFTVAATTAALSVASGVFSVLIYDVGTDANPTNAEAIQVTAGGSTLSWTGTTESGSTAVAHANGSTVLATIFTPRSISQPLNDHTTLGITPDPHTGYIRKSSMTTKGDLLPATGSATLTRLPIGTDGASLVADSSQTTGMRWSAASTLFTAVNLSAVTGISTTIASFGTTITSSVAFQLFSDGAGANIIFQTLSELTTIAASATTVTVIQIPANVIVLAIPVRVITVIPTATTFTVTGNTSSTVFNTAAVAVAATTTNPGTAAGAFFNSTAQTIRFTPSSTPGAGTGQVRVSVFYMTCNPPAA